MTTRTSTLFTKRGLLALTLLSSGLGAAPAPLVASGLPNGQLPFDSAPSRSFHPAQAVSLSLVTKDGAALCNPDGWCLIPNMPVLNQTDPAVVKALTVALRAVIDKDYPNAPMMTDPVTFETGKGWRNIDDKTYHLPSEAALLEAEVGCSLTAETMLIEALLARAPKTAVPTAKTKAYVDGNLAPALSKVQSRLTWQYLEHLIAMQKGQVDGPGLLLTSEAAVQLDKWNITPVTLYTGSDGGPDDMQAVKTDFTEFSMASMANDVRATGLTRIIFHWSKMGIVTTADGVTHIIRADTGQHKIALRGYNKTIVDQPGVYPILANDPGSGQLVKIRLTTDPKKYNAGTTNNPKIEYDFYDLSSKTLVNLGPANPGWMAMIYEGAEPVTRGAGMMDVGLGKDVQFFRIQFINGLATTFTAAPPADGNTTRRLAPRPYFPTPGLRPGGGPVERRLNVTVAPNQIGH